jgi:hypothetical protein
MTRIKHINHAPRDWDGNYMGDHDLCIAMGVYDTVENINKFGRNPAVDIGVQEAIWDGSSAYTFPTTAAMTHISQTTDQAALRGTDVHVSGLDANWDHQEFDVVLDATDTTTAVELSIPLLRCYRMVLHAPVSNDSPVRIHNAAETVDYAIISTGMGQTLMAIYTVPEGHTAYMSSFYATVNPGVNLNPTSCPIMLWAQDNANGHAPHVKHVVGLVDGNMVQEFHPCKKFTEKTDIYITAQPVGKAADISAGFDLYIIINDRENP